MGRATRAAVARRRKNIRLSTYDYREPGAYFVTVCTWQRSHLLSRITVEGVRLTPAGRIVQEMWDGLPDHFPHIAPDACVIMPDHVHGILLFGPELADRIDSDWQNQAPLAPAQPAVRAGSLGAVVRSFKSAATRALNEADRQPGRPLWQRGYWDRVLRNDDELARARDYIADNPRRLLERRTPS
jgi:putative transposase